MNTTPLVVTTQFVVLCAAILVSACSDASQPIAPAAPSPGATVSDRNGPKSDVNYVAIGTSISMGWASNGVYAGSQLVSFPALLRFGPSQQISLPLIQSPGCTSPLVAPLGSNMRLSGEPFSGSTVCANNVAGVELPTQDLGLAGAITADALFTPPENAGPKRPWFARVLPPGMTQVSAALAQHPTLVSVELGGNDILFATGGRIIPGETVTPVALFEQAFDAVLDAVGSTHPQVLIVGLPTDGTKLPALRRGDEIWADRAEFAALHVDVSQDCQGSGNYINVSVKSLILAFTGAFTSTHGFPNPVYSCANVPNATEDDYVLTPADIATLNDTLSEMANHAKQQAAARGYAFVSLGALYDLPDLNPQPYSVVSQLTSSFPYGAYISLDGVHPGPLGHSVLAHAAAVALNKTYGLGAHTADLSESALANRFVEPATPSMALEWAKRMVMEHQGEQPAACLMPGGCVVGATRRMR
jgi:lysophospholipase L1-like esterase